MTKKTTETTVTKEQVLTRAAEIAEEAGRNMPTSADTVAAQAELEGKAWLDLATQGLDDATGLAQVGGIIGSAQERNKEDAKVLHMRSLPAVIAAMQHDAVIVENPLYAKSNKGPDTPKYVYNPQMASTIGEYTKVNSSKKAQFTEHDIGYYYQRFAAGFSSTSAASKVWKAALTFACYPQSFKGIVPTQAETTVDYRGTSKTKDGDDAQFCFPVYKTKKERTDSRKVSMPLAAAALICTQADKIANSTVDKKIFMKVIDEGIAKLRLDTAAKGNIRTYAKMLQTLASSTAPISEAVKKVNGK